MRVVCCLGNASLALAPDRDGSAQAEGVPLYAEGDPGLNGKGVPGPTKAVRISPQVFRRNALNPSADADSQAFNPRVPHADPNSTQVLVWNRHDLLAAGAATRSHVVCVLWVDEVRPRRVGREVAKALEGLHIENDSPTAVPRLNRLIHGLNNHYPLAGFPVPDDKVVLGGILSRRRFAANPQGEVSRGVLGRLQHPKAGNQGEVPKATRFR